jgi:hypothetical protein
MFTGWAFLKPYIEQAVGGQWDVTNPICRVEEQATIQLVMRMWLRKRGDEK